MRFRDISIRVKLLVGFLIIALLLVITGYLGTSSMKNINMQSEIMYTDNLQVIDNIHKVRYLVMDSYIAVKDLIDTEDLEEISDIEKRIEKNYSDAESYFKIIEFKLLTGQEKELWKLFKEGAIRSENNIEELIAAKRNNYTELISGLVEELDEESELMHDRLAKMIAENSTKARVKTYDANKIYTTTAKHMNGIIIVGFILAMGIGVFMSRYISKEVNIGLEFAEALGRGDLTYDIAKYDSKDEMGQLMSALAEAQSKLKALILAVTDESKEVYLSSNNLARASENANDATSKIIHDFEYITEDIYNMDKVVENLRSLVIESDEQLIKIDENTKLIENESKGNTDLTKKLVLENLDILENLKNLLSRLGNIENVIISNFVTSTPTAKDILLELNISSVSIERIRESITSQIISVENLNSKVNEFKLEKEENE